MNSSRVFSFLKKEAEILMDLAKKEMSKKQATLLGSLCLPSLPM